MTIHKALGRTCKAIAVRISQQDRRYQLWETEQVVVVLSRTKRFQDIFWVGDEDRSKEEIIDDTMEGIRMVLNKNDPTTFFVTELLNHFDEVNRSRILAAPLVPARQKPFPRTDLLPPVGFCYLLVNIRNLEEGKVGYHLDLNAAEIFHNKADAAESGIKEWRVAMFFTCFGGCPDNNFHETARRLFCAKWEERNASQDPAVRATDSAGMFRNGFKIFEEYRASRHEHNKRLLAFPHIKEFVYIKLDHECELFPAFYSDENENSQPQVNISNAVNSS
jgi:hypothetical protein